MQSAVRERCPVNLEQAIHEHFSTLQSHLPLMRQRYGRRLGSYRTQVQEDACDSDSIAYNRRTTKHAIVRTFTVAEHYTPSIKPMAELKNITICELLEGRHHVGTKLTVKVIAKGLDGNGIGAVIEDRNGDSIPILVTHPPFDVKPNELLPSGAHIVLKQPFLEARLRADHQFLYCIRVDHPADLHVVVHPDLSRAEQSAVSWQVDGMRAEVRGDWYKALRR